METSQQTWLQNCQGTFCTTTSNVLCPVWLQSRGNTEWLSSLNSAGAGSTFHKHLLGVSSVWNSDSWLMDTGLYLSWLETVIDGLDCHVVVTTRWRVWYSIWEHLAWPVKWKVITILEFFSGTYLTFPCLYQSRGARRRGVHTLSARVPAVKTAATALVLTPATVSPKPQP